MQTKKFLLALLLVPALMVAKDRTYNNVTVENKLRTAALVVTKDCDMLGDVNINGELTVVEDFIIAGDVLLANGTETDPSLTFTSDTDTGIFRPAANQLGFTTAGAEAAHFDSTGNLNMLLQNEVRFQDDAGNQYVGVHAPTGVTSYTVSLPAIAPTFSAGNGQVLDSTSTSATQWTTATATATASTIVRRDANAAFVLAAGTLTNPAVTFTGSATNTGLSAVTVDEVVIGIAGTARATVKAAGLAVTGLISATTYFANTSLATAPQGTSPLAVTAAYTVLTGDVGAGTALTLNFPAVASVVSGTTVTIFAVLTGVNTVVPTYASAGGTFSGAAGDFTIDAPSRTFVLNGTVWYRVA